MTGRNFLKSTGIAIAHQLISTLGVMIISGELVFTFCAAARTWNPSVPAKLASRILTGIPGFPVQAVISLLLGFLLAKFFGRWVMVRVMVWMWVLPLILFGLTVLFPPMHGAPLFAPYARGNSGPGNTFLSLLSYSLPLVAAAGYSLGAKVADRRVHPAMNRHSS
jgi:hypothetical protein